MLKAAFLATACTLLAPAALGQAHDRLHAYFENADSNGDGVLSLDEFKAARAEAFSKRDRNGDGALDETDLTRGQAARPRLRAAMKQRLDAFDANQDGKVTQEEFVAGGIRAFERADTNGDGALDANERQAVRTAAQERARSRMNR
jgi:Ca2+-binding EF-hand superfamily protein